MSFSFHPEAEIELNEAIDYYEKIESGLGFDFANEVYSAIQRSVSLPKAWAIIDGEITWKKGTLPFFLNSKKTTV